MADFYNYYAVLPEYYERSIEEPTDRIVEELIRGRTLSTGSVMAMIRDVLKDDLRDSATLMAVHSMINRKLIKGNCCLVCYPEIDVVNSTPNRMILKGYTYKAVPIKIPNRGKEYLV